MAKDKTLDNDSRIGTSFLNRRVAEKATKQLLRQLEREQNTNSRENRRGVTSDHSTPDAMRTATQVATLEA